jgi:hypothetical protein
VNSPGPPWAKETPLQNLLCTHASVFAGVFFCDGNEEPRCYRTWLGFQERNGAVRPCDREACMMANFEVAMGLGRGSETANSKLQLLKYRIATRTTEVLLAIRFEPEATLRRIRREDVPNPAEILAMQAFVLLKKNPDDLARLCGWTDRSVESTFLHWASMDSFVRDALVAWRWLKPISYDQFPCAKSEVLGDRGGLLNAAWRESKALPANLAIREQPWSEVDADQQLPRLLQKDVKPRFSPVPLMLVGGPAVGKTTFLCALARHLNCARGQLRKGLYLESADLQELWSVMGEQWLLGTNTKTSETASYNLLVRDEEDPEVARWMRLRFTDYNGEGVGRQMLAAEVLRNLRTARGLLFFVDDRSFPDLLPNSGISSFAEDDHKDAVELAARYTRILHGYFDVNKNALHLPVALVVNKADLLLGPTNLLSLTPPSLIPEQTKMELVHAGVKVQAEAVDPFERLRSCVRYNLAISRNVQNQRFVFGLIERFKGFIAAALCHTYRFQIFLTSSVVPKNENGECFPRGVWDVIKWMVNQLELAYRVQANESVKCAYTELEEMRNKLGASVLRDHEAHIAFLKAVEQRKQVTAMVQTKILDQFLQKRTEHASERMQTALRDALALAELPAVPDATDPAPFPLRRRLAKEALQRLEDQITYLKEWHERLSGVHPSVLSHPKTAKGDEIRPRPYLAGARRVS